MVWWCPPMLPGGQDTCGPPPLGAGMQTGCARGGRVVVVGRGEGGIDGGDEDRGIGTGSRRILPGWAVPLGSALCEQSYILVCYNINSFETNCLT